MNIKSILSFGVIAILLGAVFIGIYYNSQNNVQSDEIVAVDTFATTRSVQSLVDSLNDFSFAFYDEIIKDEESNVFYSPYSIFTALSMAYEGARENTVVQMKDILNILQNDSVTESSFGRLYNLLNQNKEGYTINTANAFWANVDYKFLDEYINLLKSYYIAEANELDFSKNVEAAETINTWIEEQTKDKIKDMIKPEMLSDLTKLVLTNAIYFKGLWEKQFDPKNTFEADFKTNTLQTVKVNMMNYNGKDKKFNYTETEDLKILELDYQGSDLSMIIILPKENNITLAEKQISAVNLVDWKNNLVEKEIDILQIPKFKLETEYNLNDILSDMGMTDAFSPGVANFSGMDGTNDLFISKVLHKAFIDVNEEGTEAAAATAIIIGVTAIQEPTTFIADHPFIFLIQQKETGAILFMGKVMNPSE
ncbi:MAG: serpin family protein [Candidatus Thermoplasmatota archaeon]|nr:serpin family protein [Candidatus Thermoplasmatota archaeon]